MREMRVATIVPSSEPMNVSVQRPAVIYSSSKLECLYYESKQGQVGLLRRMMKCERLSWSGVCVLWMRGVRSSVAVVGDILSVPYVRMMVVSMRDASDLAFTVNLSSSIPNMLRYGNEYGGR